MHSWRDDTLMSSFYLPHGGMSITFGDVSYLLHIPIREKLLDHGRISKDEALDRLSGS